MAETSIAWTDYTFNPWWGCVRVSPGCEHCYAETFSHRLGLNLWGPTGGRRFFDDKHWHQPMSWAARVRKGDKRHRVFCASMADVFEKNERLAEQRLRLWDLIRATPELTWQLLTKRPENLRAIAPREWIRDGFPANVWLLITAEDEARFDARWPHMEGLDVVAKGVSYEPALGPINFGKALRAPRGIDWVICGGESGHGARPMELAWAAAARDACAAAGVAYFHKQMGQWIAGDQAGFVVDRWLVDGGRGVWVPPLIGERATARPADAVAFNIGGKGDDPSAWPGDWPREFPA